MTKTIFILAGSPGSGKSWVAGQVEDKFTYVPHDTFGLKSYDEYVSAITKKAESSEKPILCDTPFSLSQLMDPLQKQGYDVRPVFIIEPIEVTRKRYEERDKKPIPQGHLTRIGTFLERAKRLQAPYGSSDHILHYLRNV